MTKIVEALDNPIEIIEEGLQLVVEGMTREGVKIRSVFDLVEKKMITAYPIEDLILCK